MTESRAKILLVDDTPANIQILFGIFQGEYDLFFATSGREGVEVARRELPDLILLDIMMPEMDGYEACALLKADPLTAEIPVIFATAMGEEEDETRGLDAGAIDFLTKPISPPIVKARVRNHLELKRGRDALSRAGRELAEKNTTLERERSLAHTLLTKILPERFELPGFCTAVHFMPCDQIGGDFFDAWSDGDDAHFVIGDISGHSISAALLMAVCKGLFMSLGQGTRDPGEIVATANRILCRLLIDSGMYFTMIYLYCDRHRGVVRLVSAGHNPAYLYSSSGRVALEATGPPVGWDPDDSWGVAEYPFSTGDSILLYTDGLVEMHNSAGELCSADLFAGLDRGMVPRAMVGSVLATAASFCDGSFNDDVTVFAIRSEPVDCDGGDNKTVTFVLEPAFSSVDTVRRAVDVAVREWFDGNGIETAAADFCQVIGELVNNAVEHGECSVIEATLCLEGQRASFTLVTDGRPFDTASSPAVMPDFGVNGELPEGGFGLAIIRKLSDSLRYEYREGKNITEVMKIFKGGDHGTQG